VKGESPEKHHLENLINAKHPLCKPARRIPWGGPEKHFADLYHDSGSPVKPIRLLALLILKQLHDLFD
jgi:hypothetical protein